MITTQRIMPISCAFSPELTRFYYWDSFEARLSCSELSISDIYLGIFSYPPGWMNWLLVLRTKIVSIFGIKGPTFAQLNNVERKKSYVVGEQIALFTLFSQDEDEIITGGDDKHLEFKVSVLRLNENGVSKVALTTVVTPHNLFGKVYLFFIVPFHKLLVKTLISNAVAAKRI